MSEDELEPLITECPNCRTRFRVSEAQLQIAGGRVRCGACLGVFHGVDNLLWDGRGALASGEQAEDVLDELLDELESARARPAGSLRAQRAAGAEPQPAVRAQPAPARREVARERQSAEAREPEQVVAASPVRARREPGSRAEEDWRDAPAPLYGGHESLGADRDAIDDLEADGLEADHLQADRFEVDPLEADPVEADALRVGDVAPDPLAPDRIAADVDWRAVSVASGPFEVLEPDEEDAWRDEYDPGEVPEPGAEDAEADERRDLDLDTIAALEIESLAEADRSGAASAMSAPVTRRVAGEAPIWSVDREDATATSVEGGLDAVLREEISFAPEPRRWWPLVATAIGVLALIVQVFWYQFDAWGRDPAIRPLYAFACGWLDCELPEMQDLSRMRSRNLIVRSHPELAQALIVDAVIVNEWDYPQPFPELELVFRSVNGALVAGRRFRPDEYLAGELEGASEIAPRTPVRIELEIEDPGPDAVNYFLSFR